MTATVTQATQDVNKVMAEVLTGVDAAKADAAARDASVLNGVSKTAAPKPATPAKPARRTRTAKTDSNGAVLPARKAPAPKSAKPAAKAPAKSAKTPAAKTETKTAEPSARDRKQELAREFVNLVMDHFGPQNLTDAERERISYWARCAPTGSENGKRFWPAGQLPRPTTAGW
jgi:hypothetical protein